MNALTALPSLLPTPAPVVRELFSFLTVSTHGRSRLRDRREIPISLSSFKLVAYESTDAAGPPTWLMSRIDCAKSKDSRR
jgi:hypothetical protein